uniref:Uncharacterized protein n=1 Tax=uncultured marine virus TaxID=186617 RepID=A0A0F7LB93_9VIRU|nr:hypothetical protein [uncultured marine virus]
MPSALIVSIASSKISSALSSRSRSQGVVGLSSTVCPPAFINTSVRSWHADLNVRE